MRRRWRILSPISGGGYLRPAAARHRLAYTAPFPLAPFTVNPPHLAPRPTLHPLTMPFIAPHLPSAHTRPRTRARATQRRRRTPCAQHFASDVDLERVAQLRARELAAARLERFGEARAARSALVVALAALPPRARVVEANEQFYAAWRAGDVSALMRRWAPHGTISSVSAPGPPAVGQTQVANEWTRILAPGAPTALRFTVRHVRFEEALAWVVADQQVQSPRGKLITSVATNVFRAVGAEWLLLHHHSSPVFNPSQNHPSEDAL